jgi:hypothetical protein
MPAAPDLNRGLKNVYELHSSFNALAQRFSVDKFRRDETRSACGPIS